MIPEILQRAITKGIAQSKTWVHGAGGVGRIPVPANSFIIIYHFDYFGFVDMPDSGAVAARATASIAILLNTTVDVNFELGGGPTTEFTLDPADLAATLLAAQSAVDGQYPGIGYSVALVYAEVGQTFTFTITTPVPGISFNGDPFIITDVAPAFPVTVINGTFSGGTDDLLSLNEALERTTHQVEFRSGKSTNHFIIRDDVDIYTYAPAGETEVNNFFLNVKGCYQKDTYLVHDKPVQINILCVPDPNSWAIFNFNQLPPKSQEDEPVLGYGQSPGGISALREIRMDVATFSQQYLPLTTDFETIPPSTDRYRAQFRVDANNANALKDPKSGIDGLYWNRRSYPILNIDYVLVNMPINQFVQSS